MADANQPAIVGAAGRGANNNQGRGRGGGGRGRQGQGRGGAEMVPTKLVKELEKARIPDEVQILRSAPPDLYLLEVRSTYSRDGLSTREYGVLDDANIKWINSTEWAIRVSSLTASKSEAKKAQKQGRALVLRLNKPEDTGLESLSDEERAVLGYSQERFAAFAVGLGATADGRVHRFAFKEGAWSVLVKDGPAGVPFL
jgi:hypothetical protein